MSVKTIRITTSLDHETNIHLDMDEVSGRKFLSRYAELNNIAEPTCNLLLDCMAHAQSQKKKSGGKAGTLIKVEFDPTKITFPRALDTKEFKAAWFDWLEYRNENKKPVTEKTVKAQLKLLAPYGSAVAVEAIQKSISNGWQGLFPEKIGAPQTQGTLRQTADSDIFHGVEY